jgi:sulfoxide reductase catalytic subunit YedY
MARRGWQLPEREATPEALFLNRRGFLRTLGLGAAGFLARCGHEKVYTPDEVPSVSASPPAPETETAAPDTSPSLYPAPLNPAFSELDRPLTAEGVASRLNNFYEFSEDKEEVWKLAWMLETRPWTVEVAGLVRRPQVLDVETLIRRMPLEERLYRFRCVEAWAMAVPWTGFPLKALIDAVEPLSSARYLRLTSFFDPEKAPGQWDHPDWPWPYTEGLSMAEATHELALLATGVYGHELPEQHGAPLRLVVPWKYGYKSIKSIARVEFTEEEPPTFWNSLEPGVYDFWANVDPEIPHPAWSQATEELIGTGERRPTLRYNGYGEYVAHLYA